MEEIKIWASLYSWEELSEEQKLKVGNEFSKKEYVELYEELKSLKSLEIPSSDLKSKVMAIPNKRRGFGWISFTTGIAAALLIGFFMGTIDLNPSSGLNISVEYADTVMQETDTIYLTQTDTVVEEKIIYQTKIKTEYISNDIVINDCNENENNLGADYKVPTPEFVVEMPKMDKEKSSDEIINSIESSTTEVLRAGIFK